MKYCPRCNAIVELDHSHRIDNRGTRQQRGYSNSWCAFSKATLQAHPLCVDCKAKGLVRGAKDCHVPRYLGDVPTRHRERLEVYPLCKDCHDIRTKRGE